MKLHTTKDNSARSVPAATSRTECCLTKTVDRQMSTVKRAEEIRKGRLCRKGPLVKVVRCATTAS